MLFGLSQVSDKVGRVIEVMPNGDIQVFFENFLKVYIFNPAALRLQEPTVDETSRQSTQSTLESTNPGTMLHRLHLLLIIILIIIIILLLLQYYYH